MRFLHTADWQLGMRALHAGDAADRVRAARLTAAERVVALAREHHAEALVLAGDTFEDNSVPGALVQRTADLLSRFPGPVLLLPGNHDPLEPGSVWEHPSWSRAPNLHLLREEKPFPLGDAVFLPCPLREHRSEQDPTRWLEDAVTSEGALRIGLAHGTVTGAIPLDDVGFPLPLDRAARARLCYLALGHWHSTTLFGGEGAGTARVAYSGTHESTRFGERDSGNVLLVECTQPELPARVTPLRSGALQWLALEHRCTAEGDLGALRDKLEAWPDPAQTLLRVRLEGLLHPHEQDALVHLGELASARFLHARVESFLRPAPEDRRWVEALPAGPLRAAAARLLAWSDPAHTEQRPPELTAELAARALLELYDLATESAAGTAS